MTRASQKQKTKQADPLLLLDERYLSRQRYEPSGTREIVWLPDKLAILKPYSEQIERPNQQVIETWNINPDKDGFFSPSPAIVAYFLAKLKGLQFLYDENNREIPLSVHRQFNFAFIVGAKLPQLQIRLQQPAFFAICEIIGAVRLDRIAKLDVSETFCVRTRQGIAVFGYTHSAHFPSAWLKSKSGLECYFYQSGSAFPAPFSIVSDTLYYPCHYDPLHKLVRFDQENITKLTEGA